MIKIMTPKNEIRMKSTELILLLWSEELELFNREDAKDTFGEAVPEG